MFFVTWQVVTGFVEAIMEIADSPHRQVLPPPPTKGLGSTPAPVTPSGDYISSRADYMVSLAGMHAMGLNSRARSLRRTKMPHDSVITSFASLSLPARRPPLNRLERIIAVDR